MLEWAAFVGSTYFRVSWKFMFLRLQKVATALSWIFLFNSTSFFPKKIGTGDQTLMNGVPTPTTNLDFLNQDLIGVI